MSHKRCCKSLFAPKAPIDGSILCRPQAFMQNRAELSCSYHSKNITDSTEAWHKQS